MKSLSLSKVRNGACYVLSLNGPAHAVRSEVNALYNTGVVANIPDTYEEDKDESVTLNAQVSKFISGHRLMAELQMQTDGTRHTVRQNKFGWHARVTVRAAHLAKRYLTARRSDGTFETIERASTQTYSHVSGFGARDTQGAE